MGFPDVAFSFNLLLLFCTVSSVYIAEKFEKLVKKLPEGSKSACRFEPMVFGFELIV
jgi:hypothetical protein